MRSPLKWVGSKRRLLLELQNRLPKNPETLYYNEPFAGGASLFFGTAPLWRGCELTDTNPHLIHFYRTLKLDFNKLQRDIEHLVQAYNERPEWTFKKIRGALNAVKGDPQRMRRIHAAEFWLFNKTCFNGLYRQNKSGAINTPWGKRLKMQAPQDLEEASFSLQRALLFQVAAPGSLHAFERGCAPHFIYLDPPYLTDKPHGNAYYSGNAFTEDDYVEMFHALARLPSQVKWMLSCAPLPDDLKPLVRDYNVEGISAPRSISCKSDGRKPVEEWIVRNYG